MEYLVHPNILEITPYKPGKPIEEIKREYNLKRIVKLASNENPLPIPKNVSQAISEAIKSVRYYPDCSSYFLKKKIAEINQVNMENVIIGAGSVELISMIVTTFLKPGEKVLTSEMSFIYFRIATVEKGGMGSFVEVPIDSNYRFDLQAIENHIDERTKIIFIANPNNPTGTLLSKTEIMDFIDRIPENIIVVLDNAYHEYVNDLENYPDGIQESIKRKNLIILRTFSKIYALAGMRVGYAFSNKEIITYLNRTKAPFNVTRIAQTAALAALKNNHYRDKSANLNRINREKLLQKLIETNVKVIPSETNFLLIFPEVNISELNLGLQKEGVFIRPLVDFGIPEGMRVTVGLEEDNEFFIEKFEKVLKTVRK